MNYERTLLILSLSIKCDIIKQMYYWDQNFYWSFLHTKRRWGSMQAPWPYYYDARRIKRPRKHVSFYSWFYEMILWSEQAFWVRDGWNEYSFFTYDIGYFIKKIKLEIFKNFRYCTNFVYIYVYYAYIYLCVCWVYYYNIDKIMEITHFRNLKINWVFFFYLNRLKLYLKEIKHNVLSLRSKNK